MTAFARKLDNEPVFARLLRRSTPMRCFLAIAVIFTLANAAPAAEELSSLQKDLAANIDGQRTELVAINQDIWTFAELGLQEHRSAARLDRTAQEGGLQGQAKASAACRPPLSRSTAPASRSSAFWPSTTPCPTCRRRPPARARPPTGRATGHGCGHCALGTAAVGAALARQGELRKAQAARHHPRLRHPGRGDRHRQGLHDARRPVQRPGRLPALAPWHEEQGLVFAARRR